MFNLFNFLCCTVRLHQGMGCTPLVTTSLSYHGAQWGAMFNFVLYCTVAPG